SSATSRTPAWWCADCRTTCATCSGSPGARRGCAAGRPRTICCRRRPRSGAGVSARHEPVLLAEALGFWRNGPGDYLDATLGDGGHAEALLRAEPGARLLGTDRDPRALRVAGERLARFGDRFVTAQAAFRELPGALARAGWQPLAGALFDLGLASPQIDDPARGMSFQSEGALDLRMDPTHGEPAAARLQRVEETELREVLRTLGDLPDAGRLARAILQSARDGRLATTRDLKAAVERASGGRAAPRRLAQVF